MRIVGGYPPPHLSYQGAFSHWGTPTSCASWGGLGPRGSDSFWVNLFLRPSEYSMGMPLHPPALGPNRLHQMGGSAPCTRRRWGEDPGLRSRA